MKTYWHLEGEYFETCNCQVACPCIWLNPPSEGECKLLVAWHINEGHLEQTKLNNLNVALACYAPGNMKDGQWQAALYIDQQADNDQCHALERIYSGQEGGQPALLMDFVSEILGSFRARISFEANGKYRHMVIEGVAEAEIEGIEGINGGVPKIENPPLCVVPSHPSSVARSRLHSYQDQGFHWQFTGRNGFYSSFTYHP